MQKALLHTYIHTYITYVRTYLALPVREGIIREPDVRQRHRARVHLVPHAHLLGVRQCDVGARRIGTMADKG